MDLLIGNGIVSSQETSQPIISAAISHLWQTLSEDRKASVLQAWTQQHDDPLGLSICPQLACAEESMKDSGVDSQGASCSLLSTPEEVSRFCGVTQSVTGTSLSSLAPRSRALLRSFSELEGPIEIGLHVGSDFLIIISVTTGQHFLFSCQQPGLSVTLWEPRYRMF